MGELQTRIQTMLDDLVASGEEIGLQAAAYHRGERVVDAWAGVSDRASSAPVGPETLFTVFSVSKGVTATALHILAERGAIDYDAPIAKHWPEFAQAGKENVLVRHALSHLSGLPHLPPETTLADLRDWNGMTARLAAEAPLWPAGRQLCYHAITYGWIVGGIMERIDGRPVARIVADEIAAPLGLDGLFFGVPDAELGRAATLEETPELVNQPPGAIPNIAPDGALSAAEMNRPETRRAVLPAYGLCANARSLAAAYATLVGNGVGGVRLLSPERVRQATALQVEAPNASSGETLRFGLGYRTGGGGDWVSSRASTFGHDGYGGAIAFADPEHQFAFALTKNRLVADEPATRAAAKVAQAVRTGLGIPD